MPGSPAIGAGPNGRDLGGVVPLGASISGEPNGATDQTSATLTVGVNRQGNGIPASGWPSGSGYTHYRWRLDSAPWSAETPIDAPITIAGLAEGPHHVEVNGRRDAGGYQDDPELGPDAGITRSRTWVVQAPSALRIISSGRTGNEFTLHFNVAAGKSYTVQYKNSVNGPNWSKLADVTAQSASGDFVVKDSGAVAPSRFYRIVTPAQP